jgi:hypothetical protein
MKPEIRWNPEARRWVPFNGDNYLKMHYDVNNSKGDIIKQVWINAGKIYDHVNDVEYDKMSGCTIALSIDHPLEEGLRQTIYSMEDLVELIDMGQISLGDLDVDSTVSIADYIIAKKEMERNEKS